MSDGMSEGTVEKIVRLRSELDRMKMILYRLHDFVCVSNDWRPDSKLARDVRAALDKK